MHSVERVVVVESKGVKRLKKEVWCFVVIYCGFY